MRPNWRHFNKCSAKRGRLTVPSISRGARSGRSNLRSGTPNRRRAPHRSTKPSWRCITRCCRRRSKWGSRGHLRCARYAVLCQYRRAPLDSRGRSSAPRIGQFLRFGGSNFHITVEEYTGPGARPPRVRLRWPSCSCLAGPMRDRYCRQLRWPLRGADSHGLEWLARQSQADFRIEDAARLALVAESFDELNRRIDQATKLAEGKGATSAVGVRWGFGSRAGAQDCFSFPRTGAVPIRAWVAIWQWPFHGRARSGIASSHALTARTCTGSFSPPPRDGDAKKAQAAGIDGYA